jgi:hypothetical protein
MTKAFFYDVDTNASRLSSPTAWQKPWSAINRPCLRLPVAITVLAVALDVHMLTCCGRYFLRSTVRFTSGLLDEDPDASGFLFYLCLLLPLTNNHVRLLFMRCTTYDAVMFDVWSCTLWHAGPCSAPLGRQ